MSIYGLHFAFTYHSKRSGDRFVRVVNVCVSALS